MSKLTHLDSAGLPRMVEVSSKAESTRAAAAEAVFWVGREVMSAIREGRTPKENKEALTAASVACLTLYDMLKALSKEMRIEGLRLLARSGGHSGDYRSEIYDG